MDVLHVSAACNWPVRVSCAACAHLSYVMRSEGNARITLFAASGNARTFDYQGGDIAYIPGSYGKLSDNLVLFSVSGSLTSSHCNVRPLH